MIKPGLCSVTLAKHSPQNVLQIALEAGLQGIEWWGRDHVAHGDLTAARTIGDQTRAAGLEVACYGSYYRAGVSEAEGLSFMSILGTAAAMGAHMIRACSGNQNGSEADDAHVQAVIDDTRRIADLAAEKNIAITTKRPLAFPDDFHRHPLADGKDRWQTYFDAIRTTGRGHWALLEFVKDDSPEQLANDTAVLIQLSRIGH